MNLNAEFLARFFTWSDNVIDKAQPPAVKVASTLLPIMAPFVPAFITSLRLHTLYKTMAPNTPDYVPQIGAIISAIVLELLGWVGTIAFVETLFKWVTSKRAEYLVPSTMSFIAYTLYLVDMMLVNTHIADQNTILLFLALFSIPGGLVFAVQFILRKMELNEQRDRDDAKAEKALEREDRLKRYAIKHGLNPWGLADGSTPSDKHASYYKEQMIAELNRAYEESGLVLKIAELANMFGLDVKKSKGYISTLRSDWKASKNLK